MTALKASEQVRKMIVRVYNDGGGKNARKALTKSGFSATTGKVKPPYRYKPGSMSHITILIHQVS